MAYPPFCFGNSCPLTGSCNHYKKDINIKKEVHWEETPYNFERKKCEFYSNYPANPLNDEIKKVLNGKS